MTGALRVAIGAAVLLLILAPLPSTGGLRSTLTATGVCALAIDPALRERLVVFWHNNRVACCLLALWTAIAGASVVTSHSPVASFTEYRRDLLTGVAAFLLGAAIGQHPKTRLLLLGCAVVTWALTLVMAVTLALASTLSPGADSFRIFGDAGFYTTYAVLVLCVVPHWLSCNTVLRTNRLAAGIVISVVLWMALWVAENRMVWLTSAVVIMTLALLLRSEVALRSGRSALRAALFVALIGSLLVGLSFTQNSRMQRIGLDGNAVNTLLSDPRLDLWPQLPQLVLQKPWLGHGYGREIVADQLRLIFKDHPVGHFLHHGHNMFVNAVLSTGLVGFAALVVLFLALLATLYRRTRVTTGEYRCAAASGAAIVLSMVAKNFTDDFFVRPITITFWLLIGVLLSAFTPPAGYRS